MTVLQMERLKVDLKICNGCQLCESVCSSLHHPEGLVLRSFSAIKINFDIFNRKDKSHVCYQCKVAHCMDHCDTQALYRDEGIIKFNPELCNGCNKCIEACPFDLIWILPDQDKILKCDLCVNYETPQCLEKCPVQAISVKGAK